MDGEDKAKTKKSHKLLSALPKLKLKKKSPKITLDALAPTIRSLISHVTANGLFLSPRFFCYVVSNRLSRSYDGGNISTIWLTNDDAAAPKGDAERSAGRSPCLFPIALTQL